MIGLRGAITLDDARELEARALAAVRAGHRRLAVDMTEITAVQAGLIGALLRIRRGLIRIDGELTLIIDGPPASELVRTAGLDALAHVVAPLPARGR